MSVDSRGVGRTLVAAEIRPDASPEEAVAAADRIFVALGVRLGRWVGSDAFDALFERALASTRADHPILDRVPLVEAGLAVSDRGDEPVTAEAVRDATAATLDALVALLGRFVGEDLAARLVLQDWRKPEAEPERKP
jgi:hypothetical protein